MFWFYKNKITSKRKCFSNVSVEKPKTSATVLLSTIYEGFIVPRPAFEIYKLGTILLNRKSKKNKALYTNIQCITNTHLVNSI